MKGVHILLSFLGFVVCWLVFSNIVVAIAEHFEKKNKRR